MPKSPRGGPSRHFGRSRTNASPPSLRWCSRTILIAARRDSPRSSIPRVMSTTSVDSPASAVADRSAIVFPFLAEVSSALRHALRSIGARRSSAPGASPSTSGHTSRTWIYRSGCGEWDSRFCTIRIQWCGIACPPVTDAGLRAGSSNSSRATRSASFGGTSEDTNGCAGCRVTPLSWPVRRLSAFRSEHSCHGSSAASGPSLSPRIPSVLSEHLHTSEALRKLGLKELARSRYLHLELPSRYLPSPPSAYDPIRVHRPTVHVGRLHGAVHEHPAGRCSPRARADGAHSERTGPARRRFRACRTGWTREGPDISTSPGFVLQSIPCSSDESAGSSPQY